MKKALIYSLVILFNTSIGYAQILPGTLDVSGMPSFVQSIEDTVKEAGADDNTVGFESDFDATVISYVLDPTSIPLIGGVTSSEQNCSLNIFRYTVYMHTDYTPPGLLIEAKTTFNSGVRFPLSSPYDNLPVQPLGPRDLTPTSGSSYIAIPNNGGQAIKVFEFVGCRTDIPIQFRIKASATVPGVIATYNIHYTVVGSLL
ncbi:MAG TPA: hypothetical protein ENH91_06825 [Leeuwenhoekiella sp.]|nr:hypothetical protein [Leeuwenhoekiella sp.]